mmetsp:Transcript_44494/g.147507  ORF Transcript_44494/g.147507 Transcript_44494/m.147507 type:complete len:207 (-) Transcript_44494:320-940(-)
MERGAGGDRLHRRDRQDLLARRLPRLGRRLLGGRAARLAAAARGLDSHHKARQRQHGPHPLHRLGRLPLLQAVRPAGRAAGPPPDPRRAQAAHREGHVHHPHRAGAQPHQAAVRPHVYRGRAARVHGRGQVADGQARHADQPRRREHRRAPAAHHHRAADGGPFLLGHGPRGRQGRHRRRHGPGAGRRAGQKVGPLAVHLVSARAA